MRVLSCAPCNQCLNKSQCLSHTFTTIFRAPILVQVVFNAFNTVFEYYATFPKNIIYSLCHFYDLSLLKILELPKTDSMKSIVSNGNGGQQRIKS